jgi:hypothetical protein
VEKPAASPIHCAFHTRTLSFGGNAPEPRPQRKDPQKKTGGEELAAGLL